MKQPTLETARLRLRPFRIEDAADVVRLAGAREIADTTVSIPHPYTGDIAMAWISGLPLLWDAGTLAAFAVTRRTDDALVGAAGLSNIDAEHAQAELGYWLGVPFWGEGYATEAAACLLAYGFADLGLNRIYAHHMLRNPASARILDKIGMRREGILRQRVRKWGAFEDVALMAALRSEFRAPDRG